jgi:hypothetical protein
MKIEFSTGANYLWKLEPRKLLKHTVATMQIEVIVKTLLQQLELR